MLRTKRFTGCLLLSLLLASPAMAGPMDGPAGWWGWLSAAWGDVLEVVGVSASSEEPEPAVEPVPEDATSDACAACDNGTEANPSMDPDG